MTRSASAIIAEHKKLLLNVARSSAAESGAMVTVATPVDTGAARKSWKWSKEPSSAKPGDVLRFSSDVIYMPRLEFEAWSMQAPGGMVRVTIAQWQAIVDRAVQRFR